MPNDAKLGLVVGLGLVIAAGIVYPPREASLPPSPPPQVMPMSQTDAPVLQPAPHREE